MVRQIAQSFRALALKIASYGIMHLIVAILVAFAITRDWRMALAVGVVEPIVQTFAYTIHDRVWRRIEQRRQQSGVEESAGARSAAIAPGPAEPLHIHGCHGHRHGTGKPVRT